MGEVLTNTKYIYMFLKITNIRISLGQNYNTIYRDNSLFPLNSCDLSRIQNKYEKCGS